MLLLDSLKSLPSDDYISYVVAGTTIKRLAFGGDGDTCLLTALGHVTTQCRETVHDLIVAWIIIRRIL